MSAIDAAQGHRELRASFARAAARGELREARLSLAGAGIRTRVAGSELARAILRPFSHLLTEPDPPAGDGAEASLDLYASAETGVGAPALPWPRPRGLAWSTGRRIAVHADGSSLTALDRTEGSIVARRAAVAELAPHELSKPFPEILALWLLDRQMIKVHAAMVARRESGVLLAGPAGAGKSTASLACAAAGMVWLGDDQVALAERPDGSPLAHSLYSTARIDPAHLDRHPYLACECEPLAVEADKSVLFIAEGGAEVGLAAEPRAIVVPSGAGPGGLEPISSARALLSLAPTSVLGVIGGGAAGFARLATLSERLPCFEARHGGDPRRLPQLVDAALGAAGVRA